MSVAGPAAPLSAAFRRPSPSAAGLPDTRLTTSDGVAISARHDPARLGAGPGAAGTCVVVAHGFTGSWRRPDIRRVVAGLLPHAGVVSFDLRGHGASSGWCTAGHLEVLDVDAALTWARALGYGRVVVLGFSLGAAVALRQAAGEGTAAPPDAVVAVSGPGRWHYRGTPAMRRVHVGLTTGLGRAVLRHGFGTRVSPHRWDADPLPPAQAAARLAADGVRLLLVHGDADPYFPVHHARRLATAAATGTGGRTDGVELWEVPGMGHAEGAVDEPLLDRIARWACRT